MNRRHFLALQVATMAGAAFADTPKVQSLDDVLRWLDAMERAPTPKTTGAWPLPAVLEHLAQSIEMSMDGFPQPRSAVFQHTLGAAAFVSLLFYGIQQHWHWGIVLALAQVHALWTVPSFGLSTSLVIGRLHEPRHQFGPIRASATVGWMFAGLLVSWVIGTKSPTGSYGSFLNRLAFAACVVFVPITML